LGRALDRERAERLVQSFVTVERFVFMTAYIMRKLNEADVLTVEVTESKWPVTKFPCVVPPPHRAWFAVSEDGETWRQPIEDHYDLARGNREVLRFFKVCDYVVHHFAFAVRYDDAGDEVAVFFNSDHTNDRLYRIALPVYVGLVEEVAVDEARWVDMDRAEGRVIRRRQRPRPS
jgi:hypothetical protein